MTSISDRCKTAREGAKAGPWHINGEGLYYSVATAQGWAVATDIDEEDLALIALAPEAADLTWLTFLW